MLITVENIPLCEDHRVRKQVAELLSAGYRVSVITRRHSGNAAYRQIPGLALLEHPELHEPGSALGYLREYGMAFLWAVILAAAARRRGRVDVVQHCQPPDIYFPLAHLLRWTGATVVVDQRDLMPELFAARYSGRTGVLSALNWLERRTQRAARYAIGVNGYLRDRMVAAGGRGDRVAVVRNGPVLARVAAARPDPALRADRRFLCCWVGKMGRQDRVDLLIEAIAELVHAHGRHDTRFALIGDGECLDELRRQATRLGLDPLVGFPGWLSESEVFTYLATSDLGLDTSLQAEVSPVKAMEYMAFGVPVVAFDLPETTALVRGAGVLVPAGDVRRFAVEITTLLDDPTRRAELGTVGHDRVAADLCWERQAETYLGVIQRACGREESRTPAGAAAS